MQINDVIDAIAIKLHQTFGDSFTIYKDSIEQGFQEPCFFIALLEPDIKQIVGNRYHRTLPFDIHYFGHINADIYNVADNLLTSMEYIKCLNGDLLRGTKMSANLVDNVLHFFVSYNMFVCKDTTPEDSMEGISINGTVRGE
ncbi:DUF6838 family protein [Cytobacillus sp.]|uniref:phage tail terminator family protein n=1 Tax=Cytobacillus sp. TaxID=2675269 RepID=UPI0028BE33FA|nr:hypothetical protein [Cytobacillus sp.]